MLIPFKKTSTVLLLFNKAVTSTPFCRLLWQKMRLLRKEWFLVLLNSVSLLGVVNCQAQIWQLMFIRNRTANAMCLEGSFSISNGFCIGQYKRKICAQNSTELEKMKPVISSAIATSFPPNYSEKCKIVAKPLCSKYNLKVFLVLLQKK